MIKIKNKIKIQNIYVNKIMAEILQSSRPGFVILQFTHKLTKKLSTCEFNIKSSIPGLYPALKEIIKCFSEYGIEIHNYTDKQDRVFQKAILMLTKEFTEFFGTFKQIIGADKKELLIMLTMDVYRTEVQNSRLLTSEQKDLLLSEILLTIFEELLRKTVVSVLMFKDLVNEEFSREELRNCLGRYCCCCRPKRKKYLK